MRAARVIAQADVVLCDDLVDRRVLDTVRDGARVLHVGKRGGRASTDQAFIHRVMIREARRGQRVVRLKGGDPFVFGRGGEERDALQAAGIAVEVVPGLTSGIAAPAAIGVSVTDRRHAAGVAFVTGHARDGGAGPDWQVLARSGLTLVIYMGVARCAAIADALMAGGLSPSTPAAAIGAAHTPAPAPHPRHARHAGRERRAVRDREPGDPDRRRRGSRRRRSRARQTERPGLHRRGPTRSDRRRGATTRRRGLKGAGQPCCFIACSDRFAISSGAMSSTWVETVQVCPNGSSSVPERSP